MRCYIMKIIREEKAMIINCIKKTLAGILALSLIAGSVSIQTFADEIEQYVPQWIITTSGNDVLNPSKKCTGKYC